MEDNSVRKILETYNKNAKRFSILKPLPDDDTSPSSMAEKVKNLLAQNLINRMNQIDNKYQNLHKETVRMREQEKVFNSFLVQIKEEAFKNNPIGFSDH